MLSPSHCFLTSFFFFFNDTATTEIYTLSLHDALPISPCATGTTCPVTVADTAAPPAAVTVHSIVEGRCISTPCRTVYRDSPSPGSSPEATSHTPNPRADEPV